MAGKKNTIEARIRGVLDKVRPFVKMHGGDVELAGFKGREVILKIKGACVGCRLADLTYNKMIGGILKKEVPGIKKISLRSVKLKNQSVKLERSN